MSTISRDESGFSLVEMLATLAILLTVLGTLTVLMVSATKSEVDLTRRVQAQQQTRLALEMIRHQIHRACSASHLALPNGTASNVRLIPPSASACAATPDPATAVTWCMSGGGQQWKLHRITGTPGSCTGGRVEADYITTKDVFTLEQPSGSLAKLKVNFPVDLDPLSTVGGAYRLEDSLVLRNSIRAP